MINMTIGVIGELDRKGGGSYHQSKKIFQILSKFKDFKFKLLTVNSQKKIAKINEDNFFMKSILSTSYFSYFTHLN